MVDLRYLRQQNVYTGHETYGNFMRISGIFQNIIKTEFFAESLELNTIVCRMLKQKEESKTATTAFLFSFTGN